MDDFETFTRDRIARLRSEADALEKTLKEYTTAKARLSGAARRSGSDNPRGGAFGLVMDAIRDAGAGGLTLDQMIEAAAEGGYDVKRNTLRSQIWQAKNDGELEQVKAGLYRMAGAPQAVAMPVDAPLPNEDDQSKVERFLGNVPPHREDFAANLDDEIPF